MIVTLNESQHIKNNYICDFCGIVGHNHDVIGRAYSQNQYDYPAKHYLFSYCARCGMEKAKEMLRLCEIKSK